MRWKREDQSLGVSNSDYLRQEKEPGKRNMQFNGLTSKKWEKFFNVHVTKSGYINGQ